MKQYSEMDTAFFLQKIIVLKMSKMFFDNGLSQVWIKAVIK